MLYCSMTTNWCTTRYHHEGKFVKTRKVRYLNGMVEKLEEDVDRISYWMILGIIKYLGYDISKSFKVYYLEGRKTLSNGLKELGNDNDVLKLEDKMRMNSVVDIYIEHLHVDHESQLPEAFMQPINIEKDIAPTLDEPSHRPHTIIHLF